MRAVFYGTPVEAVPSLQALVNLAEVPLVVTRPDRPRGRSGTPQPPPVKEAARALGLEVSQPERAGRDVERMRTLAPDVAVVVAYGQILPPDLLAVPRHGFVNVHFSLLPRWRGASPVVRAILAGDGVTGVTLMQLDAGMDTGPVLAVTPTRVGDDETAGELTGRLAVVGAALLAEHLPAWVVGEITPRPQPEAGATAAARVRVEEAFVDPTRHRARGGVARGAGLRPQAGGVDGDGRRTAQAVAGPAGRGSRAGAGRGRGGGGGGGLARRGRRAGGTGRGAARRPPPHGGRGLDAGAARAAGAVHPAGGITTPEAPSAGSG